SSHRDAPERRKLRRCTARQVAMAYGHSLTAAFRLSATSGVATRTRPPTLLTDRKIIDPRAQPTGKTLSNQSWRAAAGGRRVQEKLGMLGAAARRGLRRAMYSTAVWR